jgi:hypothetical protein
MPLAVLGAAGRHGRAELGDEAAQRHDAAAACCPGHGPTAACTPTGRRGADSSPGRAAASGRTQEEKWRG